MFGGMLVPPKSKRASGPSYAAVFFKELGLRARELRKKAGYTQKHMISFGFSMRHWQQIEGGCPISMTTVLRVCDVFKIKLDDLLHGLNQNIHHY